MLHDLCRETHASLIVGKCPWCGATISHGFVLEGDGNGSRPSQFPWDASFGRNLADFVEQYGILEPRHAARMTYGVAGCLSVWHAGHGIHRAVRPDHVVLREVDDLQLLDPDSDVNYVGTEDPMCEVDYLAPEVALGVQPVDMRADLYGLGCTLYYVLCGHPPFPHGSMAQRLMSHQTDWPKPISQIRTDVPKGLSDICYRLLAKQPEDRFLSAEFVQKALKPWTKGAS